jgi:hypothetical protein
VTSVLIDYINYFFHVYVPVASSYNVAKGLELPEETETSPVSNDVPPIASFTPEANK